MPRLVSHRDACGSKPFAGNGSAAGNVWMPATGAEHRLVPPGRAGASPRGQSEQNGLEVKPTEPKRFIAWDLSLNERWSVLMLLRGHRRNALQCWPAVASR